MIINKKIALPTLLLGKRGVNYCLKKYPNDRSEEFLQNLFNCSHKKTPLPLLKRRGVTSISLVLTRGATFLARRSLGVGGYLILVLLREPPSSLAVYGFGSDLTGGNPVSLGRYEIYVPNVFRLVFNLV